MVPDWGEPPWRVTADIPSSPLPSRADVVVVGAGFAGLATAWELLRRGRRPVVLEAGRIGHGASGHSGAIALEGTAVGLLEDADTCLDTLSRIVAEAGIEGALTMGGCHEIEHRSDPGDSPLRWRDGDSILCIGETVPGGTIDAGAVLTGLAGAVIREGGVIHTQTRVTGLRATAGLAVQMTGAEIHADHVVLAINAYLPTLVPLPLDFRPVLTLGVETSPLSGVTLQEIGLGDGLPFYTTDFPYLWGRTVADGRLILGAGLVFPDGDDVETTSVGSEAGRTAFDRLEVRMRGFHPALADVAIERRWGGPIAFMQGRPPIVASHPLDPRIVVTGGCAGHGVALSFRLGEIIARHVAGGGRLPAWGAI